MSAAIRQAFLDAIREEPGADVHRLVFADWLDEHGDDPDRAEFIRCQCWLATHGYAECTGVSANWCPVCGDCICENPEQSMSDICCPLHSEHSWHAFAQERQAALLSMNRFEWGADAVPGVDSWHAGRDNLVSVGPTLNLTFVRGFVALVECDLAAWLAHGREVCRRSPGTSVGLTDREPRKGSFRVYWLRCRDWEREDEDSLYMARFGCYLPREWFPEGATEMYFDNREEAVAWANARALDWARAEPAQGAAA